MTRGDSDLGFSRRLSPRVDDYNEGVLPTTANTCPIRVAYAAQAHPF
jgi:hypothetical protein